MASSSLRSAEPANPSQLARFNAIPKQPAPFLVKALQALLANFSQPLDAVTTDPAGHRATLDAELNQRAAVEGLVGLRVLADHSLRVRCDGNCLLDTLVLLDYMANHHMQALPLEQRDNQTRILRQRIVDWLRPREAVLVDGLPLAQQALAFNQYASWAAMCNAIALDGVFLENAAIQAAASILERDIFILNTRFPGVFGYYASCDSASPSPKEALYVGNWAMLHYVPMHFGAIYPDPNVAGAKAADSDLALAEHLNQLTEQWIMAYRSAGHSVADVTAAQREAEQALRAANLRLTYASDGIRLVVVGAMKAGKSSLLSTLIGDEHVLPEFASNISVTMVPVEVATHADPTTPFIVQVHFRSERETREEQAEQANQLLLAWQVHTPDAVQVAANAVAPAFTAAASEPRTSDDSAMSDDLEAMLQDLEDASSQSMAFTAAVQSDVNHSSEVPRTPDDNMLAWLRGDPEISIDLQNHPLRSLFTVLNQTPSHMQQHLLSDLWPLVNKIVVTCPPGACHLPSRVRVVDTAGLQSIIDEKGQIAIDQSMLMKLEVNRVWYASVPSSSGGGHVNKIVQDLVKQLTSWPIDVVLTKIDLTELKQAHNDHADAGVQSELVRPIEMVRPMASPSVGRCFPVSTMWHRLQQLAPAQISMDPVMQQAQIARNTDPNARAGIAELRAHLADLQKNQVEAAYEALIIALNSQKALVSLTARCPKVAQNISSALQGAVSQLLSDAGTRVMAEVKWSSFAVTLTQELQFALTRAGEDSGEASRLCKAASVDVYRARDYRHLGAWLGPQSTGVYAPHMSLPALIVHSFFVSHAHIGNVLHGFVAQLVPQLDALLEHLLAALKTQLPQQLAAAVAPFGLVDTLRTELVKICSDQLDEMAKNRPTTLNAIVAKLSEGTNALLQQLQAHVKARMQAKVEANQHNLLADWRFPYEIGGINIKRRMLRHMLAYLQHEARASLLARMCAASCEDSIAPMASLLLEAQQSMVTSALGQVQSALRAVCLPMPQEQLKHAIKDLTALLKACTNRQAPDSRLHFQQSVSSSIPLQQLLDVDVHSTLQQQGMALHAERCSQQLHTLLGDWSHVSALTVILHAYRCTQLPQWNAFRQAHPQQQLQFFREQADLIDAGQGANRLDMLALKIREVMCAYLPRTAPPANQPLAASGEWSNWWSRSASAKEEQRFRALALAFQQLYSNDDKLFMSTFNSFVSKAQLGDSSVASAVQHRKNWRKAAELTSWRWLNSLWSHLSPQARQKEIRMLLDRALHANPDVSVSKLLQHAMRYTVGLKHYAQGSVEGNTTEMGYGRSVDGAFAQAGNEAVYRTARVGDPLGNVVVFAVPEAAWDLAQEYSHDVLLEVENQRLWADAHARHESEVCFYGLTERRHKLTTQELKVLNWDQATLDRLGAGTLEPQLQQAYAEYGVTRASLQSAITQQRVHRLRTAIANLVLNCSRAPPGFRLTFLEVELREALGTLAFAALRARLIVNGVRSLHHSSTRKS